MRGLSRPRTPGPKDERGVIAPLTAFLMTAVLGMSALVVDTALMYSEHAQLQNGADAAALAIAEECSKAATPCPSDQRAAAAGYADGNALDNRSNVLSAVADATARTVDVTTQSQMPDGTNHFSLHFAKVLGISSTDIQATATARWTYPNKGTGFPLAISQECWNFAPATATTFTLQKITWKPGTTCTNASGSQIPGGWGWLANTADNSCEVSTQVGDYASSNPGNDPPRTCAAVLQKWIDTLTANEKVYVSFPVFSTASGAGNTGTFKIVGYATFRIFGWNFGSSSPYYFRIDAKDPDMTKKLSCTDGGERCIIGGFVQYQTSEGGGGGPNFGTTRVSLIK